nr:MAG TPA: hypothetical protein [Caudoviricetes sp.]
MTEYHVGCGAFGIYAGTLKPNGIEWRNKSDVTDEAISAAAQYLLQHDESMEFTYKDKRYRLGVIEVTE